MNNNFTIILNEWIKDDMELNPKELTVLTLILMNRNNKNVCTFNLKVIYDLLGIKDNNTYSQREIKNILQTLSDEDILFYYNSLRMRNDESITIDKFGKKDIIYAEVQHDMSSEFTVAYDNELIKLIDYSQENNIDTYSLLKMYLYICSCINNNEQSEEYLLCFPSLNNIHDNVGIAENTILRYIDVFRELHIFVCDYAGFKINTYGQIKNGVMFYTRYENEEVLLNRLKKERNEKGFIKVSKRLKDKSNAKRSLKQRINILNYKENKNRLEEETLIGLKIWYDLI